MAQLSLVRKRKKLLFITMPTRTHTVGWLNLFIKDANHNFDIYILGLCFNKDLKVKWFLNFRGEEKIKSFFPIINYSPTNNIFLKILKIVSKVLSKILFTLFKKRILLYYILRFFKFDLIHSLEFQNMSYPILNVKKLFKKKGKKFPNWMVTNWGSDIYFFGKQAEHQPIIKELLKEVNYYDCESKRDLEIAVNQFCMDRNKQVFPIVPNNGGFDISYLEFLRKNLILTSKRKIIVRGTNILLEEL